MIISPLRYPGGKAKLTPILASLIEANDLFSKCYCEPYAGGAGLAIKLLVGGFVPKVKLNDLDRAIYAFWHSVFTDTDRFCSLIADCEVSVQEWRRQRSIYSSGSADDMRLGFAAYYLNRTSRSGIIEGSGPIGGNAQEGRWKIDARFNKDRQIENIASLGTFRDQFEVTCLDAQDFLNKNIDEDENFFYLDPPYYVKGKKLYKNFYSHEDHQKIRDRLEMSPSAHWLVSYDDVPEIRAIYEPREPFCYGLNYSAGPASRGSEVMFLSDSLTSPSALTSLAA